MASTTDTLVPVKVDQPAPTTSEEVQHPTTTEATSTTTSPKKILPNINTNVNRTNVPAVTAPSPNKKKGNAPIAHAPSRTASQNNQPPQYFGHPGAVGAPPPHFYPYPPVSLFLCIILGVGIIYCMLIVLVLDGVFGLGVLG